MLQVINAIFDNSYYCLNITVKTSKYVCVIDGLLLFSVELMFPTSDDLFRSVEIFFYFR